MTDDVEFAEINDAKAEMDHIYDQPDPRPYFWELEEVRYQIPSTAKAIFNSLIAERQVSGGEPIRILDLGSSYGTMAALLKYDLSMQELYRHWSRADTEDLSTDTLLKRDKTRFANANAVTGLEIIGLDPAKRAIDYGVTVGLLDEGYSIDLEQSPLPQSVADEFGSIDLAVSTGCVGYITEKTFDRIMPELTKKRPAWIANFVLRMFPFDTIEAHLAKWGYKTEKLEGHVFIQRRFTSEVEQTQVLKELQRQGIDVAGQEAEGFLMAEFFLSRPIAEAEETPIDRLVDL